MKILVLLAFGVVLASAGEADVIKDYAEGNVGYISNLYKELAKSNPANFIACPLSLQTVFALINGGAKGNTATQIATTLHLPATEEQTRQVFSNLAENFQGTDKYTLSSANKIYLADSFEISQKFKTNSVDVFNSEIQNINFGKTLEAVAEINKWVEDKTHDKIKDFVTKDTLSPNTVALLINALYFQGKWVTQFLMVVPMPFYLKQNDVVMTDTMAATDNFNYYESAELKAKFLELPYKGNDISMVFVLPNDSEGLPALEERIEDVFVEPQFSSTLVDILIPKFKIETTTNFIPILTKLGITDAFSPSADFSGVSANDDSLSITSVLQKGFIEVDKEGTTAAAASSIGVERSARQQENPIFNANHPFMFYLKHKVYGVFFVGRYSVAARSL